jgi:hypothetical protein
MKPDPDQETIIALKAQIAAKKKGRPKGRKMSSGRQRHQSKVNQARK